MVQELFKRLTPEKVQVEEQLFLDPNNPRFADLPGRQRHVPEKRFIEPAVQSDAFRKMCDRFDVDSVRDSILQVGFLPIDKMVARPISGEGKKYVMVEGNRRLAALKWIIQDHNRGELTLSESALADLQEIEILVLQGWTEEDQWILQGVRHMSGVRAWGLYQQAQAVMTLRNIGMNPRQIKELFSLRSVTQVNRYIRAYLSLQQMAEDEEYGQYATPDMFSYFEEGLARPYIRDDWLNWDEEQEKCTDKTNLQLLYGWITPSDELDGEKKLPMAIDLRRLPAVLQHQEARRLFMEPSVTIDQAHALTLTPPPTPFDWRKGLNEAADTLTMIPMGEEFAEDDLQLLDRIKTLASERIKQIKRLRSRTKKK